MEGGRLPDGGAATWSPGKSKGCWEDGQCKICRKNLGLSLKTKGNLVLLLKKMWQFGFLLKKIWKVLVFIEPGEQNQVNGRVSCLSSGIAYCYRTNEDSLTKTGKFPWRRPAFPIKRVMALLLQPVITLSLVFWIVRSSKVSASLIILVVCKFNIDTYAICIHCFFHASFHL